MGKAKRIKEERAGKKDEVKKPSLVTRIPSDHYLKRNIAAFDKSGLKDFIIGLSSVKEKVVPIDPKIVINGIKNPLVATFIGFSTTKLLESLKRKKKTVKYVCIIEPNVEAFKHLICTEDITELLEDPMVDFVIGSDGPDIIPQLMKKFSTAIPGSFVSKTTMIQNMEIILDPFQYNTPELVEKGKEKIRLIQETVQLLRLSMGCSDDQYRRFEMMIENKKHMYESWKINGLYDKFKDSPVIVCGGGPSLNQFIEAYKTNDKLKNGLIIAVDAVLKKLLDNGIKPHIVTRCERKETSIFKGITKDMTEGIYYAAYPWTPGVYFDLFHDSFYLFRQNGVCLFTGLSHAFADGGVSSGNAALELAINFGAKNILLTGIDLGFIGGKSHIDGTMVEFNPENSKDKWEEVEANDGSKITTIPVWKRCLNEYMQAINKHNLKGVVFTVHNMSEKGAKIPLTQVSNWDKIGGLFEGNVDIKKIIESNRSKLTKEEINKFEDSLKVAVKKMEECSEYIRIAQGLADDAKRTAAREIEKLVNITVSSYGDNPYDIVKAIRQNKPNFEKLWKNVAESIDQNFKTKCYPEHMFRILVFDVLQLDLFHYENAVHSTVNTLEYQDERCEAYYKFSKEFMMKCRMYCDKFAELIRTNMS